MLVLVRYYYCYESKANAAFCICNLPLAMCLFCILLKLILQSWLLQLMPCLRWYGTLSRHQTIDKVGQLCGRGLVSEDNRLMKSLNHDTCHLSRHDCDVKKWQAIRTPTLLCCFIFWLRNNIKSGPYGSAVGYSTGKQFAGRTFHRPIVFGN